MQLLRASVTFLLAVPAAVVSAQTWENIHGDRFAGTLTGVYGPMAVIADRTSTRLLPIAELKDADLERVADFIAAQPAQPPAWSAAGSKVAKALKGRLQVLRGEKLVDFDPGSRAEPEVYLVYFGAEWCPPCRTFSPRLVAAYERLKQLAPDKFEVVFVSSDREPGEQLRYVRHVGMPWPVLKFSHLGRAQAIERWAGNGIPCLVAVTREGEALFHSYRGTEYVGPNDVLERFEQLLRAQQGKGNEMKRLMHRLAVVQHIRAAGASPQPVRPYVISMDLSRYRTLEVKQIVASLDIDEKGAVVDATFEPELPAVINHQLQADAGTWLFLPAVNDRKPVKRKVKLPLNVAD